MSPVIFLLQRMNSVTYFFIAKEFLSMNSETIFLSFLQEIKAKGCEVYSKCVCITSIKFVLKTVEVSLAFRTLK